MTSTVIAFAFVFLMAAAVLGTVIWQAYDRGGDTEKLKEEKRRADEAEAIRDSMLEHPLSAVEQLNTLRRVRNRGGLKRWVSKARAGRRS